MNVLADQAAQDAAPSRRTTLLTSITFGVEYLPPAECQQTLRERRGTMSGVGDRAHIAAERIVRRQAVEKNSAIAGDDGQQIVEIVRDAAGKLADGFHLLRLTQLCLELQAIADIGDAAANQGAARVGQARESDLARDVAPVTRAMGPIEERRSIDDGLVKVHRGCVNRSPAVRLELRADINRRLRHQFLCGPPEHVGRFLVVLDEASEPEIQHHNGLGRHTINVR